MTYQRRLLSRGLLSASATLVTPVVVVESPMKMRISWGTIESIRYLAMNRALRSDCADLLDLFLLNDGLDAVSDPFQSMSLNSVEISVGISSDNNLQKSQTVVRQSTARLVVQSMPSSPLRQSVD